MAKALAALPTAILLLVVGASVCTAQESQALMVEVVAEGLDTPWAIAFLPDGSMLITERPGRVLLRDTQGELRTIAELEVIESGESGLHGLAVDPGFEENRHIYLYYAHESGNRISRFTFDEQERLAEETILLDAIPLASNHDGGRLKFGPDGMLYATTGDAGVPERAQDTGSLAGKVLRINSDGTIPDDNPFGGAVYSYGHRNPEGIAWRGGELYLSEHGPSQRDEINLIAKGADYGWPQVCGEGEERGAQQTVQPLRCYTEFTLAPAGIAFLGDDLYVAGLRGAQLRRISLNASGAAVSDDIVLEGYGRLREVLEHEGALYVSTSNRDGRGVPRPGDDKILRITFPADATASSAGDQIPAGMRNATGYTAVAPMSAGMRQLGILLLAAGIAMLVLGLVLPKPTTHARTSGVAHRRRRR